MSVDITKGATVELVKTLSDDLRTKDDNTKYSSAGAAMRDKANVDGYYEGLTSGTTEQILSSVYEEDSEPYLFRTSGGSLDIGDREEDTIVGGTVAWNQLSKYTNASNTEINGLVFTNNNDGSFSVSGTASADTSRDMSTVSVPMITGHVYALRGCPSGGSRTTYMLTLSGIAGDVGSGSIYKHTGTGANYAVRAYFKTGTTINAKFVPQCFDLTQMFGSTIADYIYSLEQANAGAGVAWFKKLFPKPYYAYNAGELLSVEGLQSHDMVGFNAWDEQWEVGLISVSTGENVDSNQYSRSKNYIKVLPNTNYYFKHPATLYLRKYDADKNYLSYSQLNSATNVLLESNVHYIRIVWDGTTYHNDICINLHWDGERDGEYEPYKKHSYPLDSSLVLRGIFKLDENNKLRCDGDVYRADGTVERKYGIVDLGTLTWALWPNYTDVFRVPILNNMKTVANEAKAPFVQAKYELVMGVDMISTDKSIAMLHGGYVAIHDSAFTDAASFKTAMSGVYLVYELATPTTEEAEPYQTPQIVDDFGTEEYVTDSIVPVGHVTKYMPNLKAKLEMAPDSPSDNGDYIVRHTNGQNEYVPLVIPTELPAMPTGSDGTYVLKVTVSNGTATLAWEAE